MFVTIKAIAMHTFVVILWGPRNRQYLTAYATVGLTWLFLILFIAISVSLHTHGSNVYESPAGVSLPCALTEFRFPTHVFTQKNSIGAGSGAAITQNNSPVNMFGSGPL